MRWGRGRGRGKGRNDGMGPGGAGGYGVESIRLWFEEGGCCIDGVKGIYPLHWVCKGNRCKSVCAFSPT